MNNGCLSRIARLGVLPWVCAWATAVSPVVASATEIRTSQGLEFYEKKIRPLLASRCYKCHSTKSKRVRGGLILDSATGWQRGGDSGSAVVLHKPELSLLVKAVRYTDSDLKMPPKNKLTKEEIRLLEQWIKMGAPAPRDVRIGKTNTSGPIDEKKGGGHWAYQSISDPTPPQVRDTKWPTNSLDRFVLARLEENGIKPAKPAGKRTLIRRATYDLIGLPPTPKEVQTFLADKSPEAFTHLVDRLLASPRYGERWGRHWLDVARYADSNGLDENIAHGNAWRYRDYVIASFNNDKPFNEFVMEQIAGDLLPANESNRNESSSQASKYERLIATGFLSLGPKVLAEVDETKMQMDIVDEQIDTVGKALLGMTLGCARCHDHKFDPITTGDYYALAGIFKSTRTMEHFKKIARWWENPIPTGAESSSIEAHKKKLAVLRADIEVLVKAANAALVDRLANDGKLTKNPESQYDDKAKARLKSLRATLAKTEKEKPPFSTAIGVTEGKVMDVPIHLRGSHLKLGKVVPRRFPVALAGKKQTPIASGHSGRLEFAKWLADSKNPLTARVMVNRIWRWHFGKGLVRTPDNFGRLGELPTHPQLLDWMAQQFIEDGWSIKTLHRRIMLSSTYCASSTFDTKAAAVDPTNRLHWRADVRRLEAEAVRDAILAVSGRLDRKVGGSLLHVKNREFLFDHTSNDKTQYTSTRRSIYLPVIRNHLYDVLALYDFPDSAMVQGDRPTTTIAPQTMLAMNGKLIWESAGNLAQWALSEKSGDEETIVKLYQRLLSRAPQAAEIKQAQKLLQLLVGAVTNDEKKNRQTYLLAWQTLCQTLLASNEFIYIH